MTPSHEAAVTFAMAVIHRSKDWQDVQHALADHADLRPWIDEQAEGGDDALSIYQGIIREAEDRLGDRMPPNYG